MVLFVAKVKELCGYLRSCCPLQSIGHSPGEPDSLPQAFESPTGFSRNFISPGASPALEVRSCHDVLGLVSTLSWSWCLIPFEHAVA